MQQSNGYELYIGNKNYSSWSLRPWLLMTELDIEFTETLIPFTDGDSRQKFRAFSPTGLVPCLVHGATTVWESLSIVEYLAERHDGVWPHDPATRAWARSASAEMHAGFGAIRNRCPMAVGLTIELREHAADLQSDLARLSELWQDGLDRFGGPYLAGRAFTAVDAFFAPLAFRINTYRLAIDQRSRDYTSRLLQLDGMRRWHADGCRETWREPRHEAELRQLGEWLEDRRTT